MAKHVAYIKDSGGSGKVLILLHGFLADSSYWRRLRPNLKKGGYRVISIDLLGFGNAPKPMRARYDYAEHISHLHASIQSLSLGQQFCLIGHSMGSLLAMRYANLYAEEVSGVILLNPPLYINSNQARTALRDTGRAYRFLLDSRYRAIGWMVLKTFAMPLLGRHSRRARECSLTNIIEQAELVNDLQRSSLPALVITGRHDRTQYLSTLRQIKLPSTIRTQIIDAAHHAPLQQPKAVSKLIVDFVQDI